MRRMPGPETIDVRAATTPASLARAVEALRRGELLVLPTETVYGVAALAGSPAAAARLARLKQGRASPYALAFPDATSAVGRVAPPGPPARRIMERWWPGPVTLLLRDLGGALVGLRVPGHAFTRALLAELRAPLQLTSANRPGAPAPRRLEELDPAVREHVALLVDGGPAALGEASTIVEPRGLALAVRRDGVLSRDDLSRHAVGRVLVVCSGNTCRSPMAEALLRRAIERRIALLPDAAACLAPHIASAGLHARDGQPATEAARRALDELGLDLAGHRSRPVDAAALARHDLVLAATRPLAEALTAALPVGGATRVATLDPEGLDVDDPFGQSLSRYRAVAQDLAAHAEAWAARALEEPFR